MLLKSVIAQSPESIVITDPQARIVYTSPRFEASTGYTQQEVVGKNLRIFQSGLTSAETFKDLWDTLQAGQVWRGELCDKRKNGQDYPLQAIISPVKNKQGEVINYQAIEQYISEQKAR